MKREYKEPMLLIEDFKMSEMIAKDCEVVSSEIKIVQQVSEDYPSCSASEGESWYPNISDAFDGSLNLDNDWSTTEYCFTGKYAGESAGSHEICNFDPFEHGITFGGSLNCTPDQSVLIKS